MKVRGQEIGYGQGHSIRVAKREAAVEALRHLRANSRESSAGEDSSHAGDSDNEDGHRSQ
jgi:Double-stranded RNA binding motif